MINTFFPGTDREFPQIYGFGTFLLFLAKTVWVKMWVNRLTHTVTHTRKCAERFRKHRAGSYHFPPGIFVRLRGVHMTCSIKLPMVFAASSCFCRVAWV